MGIIKIKVGETHESGGLLAETAGTKLELALHAPHSSMAVPTEGEANISGGVDFANLPVRNLGHIRGARSNNFQIVIRQSALNKVHAHGDLTPGVEICGVLIGDVFHDEVGPFVLIEDIVEGTPATGSAGQVTFTAETWQYIQSEMDEKHPSQKMVGWYHTHPGHGIFLSEMDMFLHKNFFGLPWQTALVYDPQRAEEGIFGWHFGSADRAEHLVESDAAQIAYGKDAGGHNKVAAMPMEGEISPDSAGALAPSPRVLKADAQPCCGPHPAVRVFTALTGLGLFAVLGYLLGSIILDLHLKLPPLPFKVPFLN
ncbi:MAG: Mov34/MPN/PAD-1 family protein [Planctomycetota bacterium]|nr:Mov34/MPN/PAD-1 family protein [Planctomycetota bacterium]